MHKIRYKVRFSVIYSYIRRIRFP